MLKIIFYIKSNALKLNGESPIYAKISNEHQAVVLSTGKSISAARWNSTNKLRNVLKLEKEKVLKQSLENMRLKFESRFNELSKTQNEVDLSDLKDSMLGKTKVNKITEIDIVAVFDLHNSYFLKKVKAGERSAASFQKYERSKDLIQAFITKSYGVATLEVSKLNSAFVYNLEAYLKYESIYKGKVGIQNNSVVKYFKNFKTVCNYAIKMDLIVKNPFDKYDGKLNVTDATFLSEQELSQIENKIFDIERLERVRNIFLFCCYTGYAPIDAESLTESNLLEDANGNFWIITDRIKTGIRANVPVLPQAKRIIQKYKGLQTGLIPKISNQKMNAYLKEIADVCKINKNLTWYVARHTFATTITLGNGIRIENVSAMMGHSNIKQTQHYAKVLDRNVMEDMKGLMEKFKS